ncbi:Tex family protein [Lyngbya confervoides]|uniref:RNA-binding transcriptional accessory protein n=1 Tax=Lyngbya confervoides BDU141951 TaxID=1574623 RepID=A0ABD4T890_9CYAN|nr:Tex family protein [Lyngbya confervoides]MCM1984831.1 RNA-binding transcriptional accessory protein [Lyngbya confervoides BDU141951]
MVNLAHLIAQELQVSTQQVHSALALLAEGATVPFIARYRKERTGGLDEVQLRAIAERHTYLTELEDRKGVILTEIDHQGKLTPALQQQIQACRQKTELEDLYLPYRPKRRTRATMAREQGLEPLARQIEALNQRGIAAPPFKSLASPFVQTDRGVDSVDQALQGAADILAEEFADQADLRAKIRQFFWQSGDFTAKIPKKYPEGSTKYEMYRQFRVRVSQISAHNLLALFRGEAEGILRVDLDFDSDRLLTQLEQDTLQSQQMEVRQFFQAMIQDAFQRLLKPALVKEIRSQCKAQADEQSIQTFAANLRDLLLASPAGMKPTLGIDPGFRTGCKVAVLDATGQFIDYQALFPHQGPRQRQEAATTLQRLITDYQIELIAIGNGTASRETDAFVGEVLSSLSSPPTQVMVNESGASIYSASPLAIAEFPDLDVTVRGAISIGRRLQDPLAELVKIDPKSIGVGQYQHDVDQKALRRKLTETVESCVNYVGVDLNTASQELLTYVSGITPTLAHQIIEYRNQHGAFGDRQQLLKVKKLGPKAFEQSAGFLRIRRGSNPLDNTAVHPESYGIVEAMAKDLQLSLDQPTAIAQRLQGRSLKAYLTDTIGEPTLRDILAELEKPGRDPRAEFKTAHFREDITRLSDLQPGLRLEGVVTNVTNFGAFVDIGVHQDGLVHISQMAHQFVRDPKEIVKVGQVVQVTVLEVNAALKRIGLSLKA